MKDAEVKRFPEEYKIRRQIDWDDLDLTNATIADFPASAEFIQDTIGTILVDGTTIDFTYSDATPSITAEVKDNSVGVGKLTFTATDKLAGRSTSGAGAGEEITCTAAGRALLDDASAAAQRTTLDVPSNSEAILDTIIAAKGDLIVGTADNTPAILTVGGTNGHVLTIDSGEATGLKWAAASGSGSGSYVFLEEQVASSSASLAFTNTISSTYEIYVIEIMNLRPATDGATLWMRVSTDGGSTYISTGTPYSYIHFYWRAAASAVGGATAQNQMLIAPTNDTGAATWGMIATLKLYQPQSTSVYKQIHGTARNFENTVPSRLGTEIGAVYESTNAINAFQFLYSSGNIASGTIRTYGIAHA